MLSKDRLLHPATIIATIALLVALSGVGYAATKIGTAQLKNNAVTTAKIKNNAISSAKVRSGAVVAGKLAPNAVTARSLAPNAVTGADLAPGSVGAAALADGGVGGPKIATGAITAPKLANGSVSDEKLGPNAVTGSKIAGATITAANIAAGQVVKGNGELVNASLTFASTGAANTTLLTLPNIANVLVDCAATGASTTVQNTSGTTLTATVSGVRSPTGAFAVSSPVLAGASTVLANGATGGIQSATWQLSYGAGTATHIATVTVSAEGNAAGGVPGTGCTVVGQALTTN